MKHEDLEKAVCELREENHKLRTVIAKSDLDCIYCNLPKSQMSLCRSGFPGCGRADDLIRDL